jgi:hypothetical protein
MTSNPTFPVRLDEIINQLLEKGRELRCQTAAELPTDLKRLKLAGACKAPKPTVLILPYRFEFIREIAGYHGRFVFTRLVQYTPYSVAMCSSVPASLTTSGHLSVWSSLTLGGALKPCETTRLWPPSDRSRSPVG